MALAVLEFAVTKLFQIQPFSTLKKSMCKLAIVSCVLLLSCWSCSSSGPKTQYYSLFADRDIPAGLELKLESEGLQFGVGPIVLPEYVDHPGIVSLSGTNRLIVSGYNAWAGDLEENVSRVLASNLSAYWQLNEVWPFPWDTRNRPEYQIRLVFETFSGVKGGDIHLKARWTLLKKHKAVLVGAEEIQSQANGEGYNHYVAALNAALNSLSGKIATNIVVYFNP